MEAQRLRQTVVLATLCCAVPSAGQAQGLPELPASRVIQSRVADAHRWVLRQMLEIGSSTKEGPEQFFRISDARHLDANSIMIANAGSGAIRVFDFSGRYVRSFGGSGRGPGEFTYLAGLHSVGDTVLAIDYSPRQVSWFDRSGRFLRMTRFAEGTDVRWPTPLGFLEDGTVLAVNGQAFESGQLGFGLVRPPFEVLGFPAGSFESPRRIATFPGTEFWVTREPDQVATKSLLGPETIFAVGGSSFWLANSDHYDIWRFSMTGEPEVLIRVPVANRRPDRGEIEARIEQRLWPLPPGPVRERTLRALRAMRAPARRPLIQRLVASSSGELWVMLSQSPGAASVEWHIFDHEGRLIAALSAPARFQITEIHEDRVIGIWRNETDVEFVRVYAIDKRD